MFYKKSIFFYLILIVGFTSCKKKEVYSSLLIGHAGAGIENPTAPYHYNSKESINYALAHHGIDGVEIDIRMSKDSTLWIYHDPLLDDITTSNSCVETKTDSELSDIKYTSIRKEKLIKLSDLTPTEKTLFLDIKHYNQCENIEISLENFIKKIESSSIKNYQIITNKTAFIPYLLVKKIPFYVDVLSLNEMDELNNSYGITNFEIKNQHFSEQDAAIAQSKGYDIIIYEVRSAKNIRKALKKKPRYLFTDDLQKAIGIKYR